MNLSNKKILAISSVIHQNTGGGVVNQRNIDLINGTQAEVTVFYIDGISPKAQSSLFGKINERLHGIFGGLSQTYLHEIQTIISELQPDVIFLNQSLYGSVAKLAKKLLPKVTLITFFHNAETIYFDSIYKTKPLHPGAILNKISSRKAEKMAIDYSDYLICMNNRDSNVIKKLYGRSADLLLPTSFDDKGAVPYHPSQAGEPLRLLFVGFNFFANLHGLKWFCNEVMPKVEGVHLTVVGRDMEKERERLERDNITVVGSVDDLRFYYSNADMIVSPIFLGSGMKTKTAEALMYGLPLLATGEALEGYDIDTSKVGAKCNNALEFIERLTYFTTHRDELPILSSNARRYFETQYSQTIAQQKLSNFFQSCTNE